MPIAPYDPSVTDEEYRDDQEAPDLGDVIERILHGERATSRTRRPR